MIDTFMGLFSLTLHNCAAIAILFEYKPIFLLLLSGFSSKLELLIDFFELEFSF